MTEKKKEKVRFYRSGLATVVWDPKNERALAEFLDGTFTTSDSRAIGILREIGYPEVDPKATRPPQELMDNPVTEKPAPQRNTAFDNEDNQKPAPLNPFPEEENQRGPEGDLDDDVPLEEKKPSTRKRVTRKGKGK